MISIKINRLLKQAGVFALLAFGVSTSLQAAGTLSGTTVDNTATVDYQVNGIDQNTESTNQASFVVDNKVDLTVVANGDLTVTPGSTDQVLSFEVTNTGNTTQGYQVVLTGAAGDTIDMTTTSIYLDVNGDGALDAGDTLYTPGTNIADIAPDASIQVLVVADAPLSAVDGDSAAYDLTAITLDAGTTTVTTDDAAAVEDPTVVQDVFADGAGTIDAALDGTFSAAATYNVATAALDVQKSAEVISDPFNGVGGDGTEPKAIPGAVVRYTITVENSSATDATDVTVVDLIPANTTCTWFNHC